MNNDKLRRLLIEKAEEKLAQAKVRLREYLESDSYRSRKCAWSLIFGIVLGWIVAFMSQLRMFGLLGIKLPWPRIDMLVTGLVIGTGSAPVHSLIGLLQNTKDAMNEARALWRGKAYSEIAAELRKLEEIQRQVEKGLPEPAEEVRAISNIEISRRVKRILR